MHGTASGFYDAAIVADWAPETPRPEQVADLVAAVERREEVVVVAEDAAGRIVGFGSIVPLQSELRAVYVDPSHGRRGIGRRILAYLEEHARLHGLAELRMDASLNAEAFYRAHGYALVERAEHVLRSGRRMPCVRMAKRLA